VKQPQQLIKEEEDKIEDLQAQIAELRKRVGPGLRSIRRYLTRDIESGPCCEESPIPEIRLFAIPVIETYISTTHPR
jgi:hypothetical protein